MSDPILETLRRQFGLEVPRSRHAEIRREVAAAVRRVGAAGLEDYLNRIAFDRALRTDLASHVTIGETYFFREPLQYAFLGETAIGEILAQRPEGHRLRLWSAGCASGEEAYSLAMLVAAPPRRAADILGTDVSGAAIERARAAIYRRWALRGDGADVARRWLVERDGRFHVPDAIRSMVRFELLNLIDDPYPAGLDVILCRNALLYFDEETVARVAARLCDALAPGGYLLTSSNDPRIPRHAWIDLLSTPAGIVHRKRFEALAPPPATADATPRRPSPRPLALGTQPPRRRPGAGPPARAPAPAAKPPPPAAAEVASLDPARHLDRAIALLGQGRRRDAEGELRSVLYLDGRSVAGHFLLGNLLARRGATSEALRAYRRTRRLLAGLSPASPVSHLPGEPAGHLLRVCEGQIRRLGKPRMRDATRR